MFKTSNLHTKRFVNTNFLLTQKNWYTRGSGILWRKLDVIELDANLFGEIWSIHYLGLSKLCYYFSNLCSRREESLFIVEILANSMT
jgi:hypothetical protein